jgi:hypothetical protein
MDERDLPVSKTSPGTFEDQQFRLCPVRRSQRRSRTYKFLEERERLKQLSLLELTFCSNEYVFSLDFQFLQSQSDALLVLVHLCTIDMVHLGLGVCHLD